jgi:hypothetical protein
VSEATPRITGIFLSTGIQLVWEEDVYHEGKFADFGFTLRAFRLWLKALGVPRMKTPGGKWLLDLVSLHLAVRAIMRVGQEDFFCPGTKERSTKKYPKRGYSIELDEEYFANNWMDVCNELLYAQRINWTLVTSEHRDAFNKAARRISLALAQQQGESLDKEVRTLRVQGRRALRRNT